MGYLILVLAAAFAGWWGYRRFRHVFGRGEVRIVAASAAIIAFGAAAFCATRESWSKVVTLALLGLWMLLLARAGKPRAGQVNARAPSLSTEDARQILGVAATATREEIQDAYVRLIRIAHPDTGGTTGLAAQLNAARDRLLKG
jgi:uncharacterized membrane protein YfcA